MTPHRVIGYAEQLPELIEWNPFCILFHFVILSKSLIFALEFIVERNIE